jgi:hypothetical protein
VFVLGKLFPALSMDKRSSLSVLRFIDVEKKKVLKPSPQSSESLLNINFAPQQTIVQQISTL